VDYVRFSLGQELTEALVTGRYSVLSREGLQTRLVYIAGSHDFGPAVSTGKVGGVHGGNAAGSNDGHSVSLHVIFLFSDPKVSVIKQANRYIPIVLFSLIYQ
jgi:hypothetical protein